MPDKLLYEYAVIRFTPRIEREEFFNVGIILYCKKAKYLDCCFWVNKNMLVGFAVEDPAEVCAHLQAFQQIARGNHTQSSISQLPQPERFRWLTARRSTIIQTSAIHSGFAHNLEDELQRLMRLYVGEA